MSRSRVIFFGSRDSKFSDELFFALADTDCDIVAVVHSPEGILDSTSGKKTNSGYAETAEKTGIPCFMPDRPNSADFAKELKGYPCDAFILAGYALLVKETLLTLPEKGIAINFHASLLPDYKGRHPVFWAIRNGETKSGITAHHLSLGLDEGDIAFQEAVEIGQDDSASDVYDKVIEKSRVVMRELIDAINRDDVPVIPQEEGGKYYSSIKEEDYMIDFTLGADRNKWAVQATPGKCYIETGHGRIYAYGARVVPGKEGLENGLIIAIDDEIAVVSSKGEAICFTSLSTDGGPLPAGKLMQDLGYKVCDKL